MRPRQRSASSSTPAAPGTCAAASAASVRLRAIVSSGSVLANRSLCLTPVARAGNATPARTTQLIKSAVDRFIVRNVRRIVLPDLPFIVFTPAHERGCAMCIDVVNRDTSFAIKGLSRK